MKLGNFIEKVSEKNTDNLYSNLLGINKYKEFISSVANIVGTDLSKYKLLRKNYFACNPMHVGRDKVLPICLYQDDEPSIISPAYMLFKVKSEQHLNPNYLMLWFRRKDLDHYLWFKTDSSVRGSIGWEDLCNIEFNPPSIEIQNKTVEQYTQILSVIESNVRMINNISEQIKNIFLKFVPLFGKNGTVDKVKNIFDISIGGTPDREDYNAFSENELDLPWVSIADMKDKIHLYDTREKLTNYAQENYRVKKISKDTVIMSFKLSVGRVGILKTDMATNEAIAHFNTSNKEYKYYTYCYLKYFDFNKLGSTSSIATAYNSTIIKNMPFLIPTQEDLEKFNNKIETFFELISSLERENMILENLKRIFLLKITKEMM